MTFLAVRDRALFTTTQLALLDSSVAPAIESLSLSRIKTQIARARKYGDKYRDLTRHQSRKEKKAGRRAADGKPAQQLQELHNARKAQLMATALQKLVKRRDVLQRRDAKRKRRGPIGSSNKRRGAAVQSKSLEKRQQRRRAANEAASGAKASRQFQKTRRPAIHAHIRARGQRQQARRDAR